LKLKVSSSNNKVIKRKETNEKQRKKEAEKANNEVEMLSLISMYIYFN